MHLLGKKLSKIRNFLHFGLVICCKYFQILNIQLLLQHTFCIKMTILPKFSEQTFNGYWQVVPKTVSYLFSHF